MIFRRNFFKVYKKEGMEDLSFLNIIKIECFYLLFFFDILNIVFKIIIYLNKKYNYLCSKIKKFTCSINYCFIYIFFITI